MWLQSYTFFSQWYDNDMKMILQWYDNDWTYIWHCSMLALTCPSYSCDCNHNLFSTMISKSYHNMTMMWRWYILHCSMLTLTCPSYSYDCNHNIFFSTMISQSYQNYITIWHIYFTLFNASLDLSFIFMWLQSACNWFDQLLQLDHARSAALNGTYIWYE